MLAGSLLLVSIYPGSPAFGQATEKTSAEEILFADIPVVTAAKRPQTRSEAPAAVVVITAEDIKNSGARTIAEAIQYKAGINVFGLASANIRGVGTGSRLLLLIDGARVNGVFAGGFQDGLQRPLTEVERIEVIKGPGSSLYGTNAFSGVINIITRKPEDNTGWTAQASGGNLSTQNYQLLAGLHTASAGGLFSFSAYSTEGNNLFGSNDFSRDFDLFGKLQWKGFTLSGQYRPNRNGIPNIGGLLTPASFIKGSDGFGHLEYEATLPSDWTFSSQLMIHHEGTLVSDPQGDTNFRDLRVEGEARANHRFGHGDNLTFGLELRRDRTNNRNGTESEIFTSNNRGFYIENEYRWKPFLILTTGFRFDDNSVFTSSVNPRIGIVMPLSSGTVIKTFAGSAFRGPEFLPLFTDIQLGSFVILHNPSLKPEKVNSYEFEVSHFITHWLTGRMNVYHNSLRDLITANLIGTQLKFVNLGEASANGLELVLTAKPSKQIDLFSNYSLQSARDQIADKPLPLIPRNTINFGVTIRSSQGFTLSCLGKLVGSRPSTNLITHQPITLPRYFKMDLVASARISDNLEFSTSIYNLFDARYSRDFALPQNGIEVLAGLRYRSRKW